MEREECLMHVKRLRDEYSSDIPKNILHSSEEVNGKWIVPKYKVRSGWWFAVYSITDLGIDLGYFSDNVSREYEMLQSYIDKTNFRQRLTTKEDIEKADGLLNLILKEAGIED